ncbi:hypothetical protein KAU87_00485 [Candidatus Bathyarchaeota archaeon]|nr:hypothetical protein [Candidatus Bathyarchaeota archaeon]
MPDKASYIDKFVLGFGFLGGLLFRVGVDPEGIILESLFQAFLPFPDIISSILAFLIAAVLTLMSVVAALESGGTIGVFAVSLGWLAGFILVGGSSIEAILGLVFLILAVLIGETVHAR